MNKNVLIGLLVLVLVGAGGYTFMQKKNSGGMTGNMMDTKPTQEAESMEKTSAVTGAMTNDSKTVSFTVEGGKFYFKPNTITVKKGATVTIVFNNKEGLHDWVVDEFNARTKQIKDGETDKVTFVADKVGTFEYYCSVMQHRSMGMVGKLIVEE